MAYYNRIFLAHAREDEALVRNLHGRLKKRGFDPWLDKIDLIPGQRWTEEIPKAIAASGVFLACLSKHSVRKRGYVQREFRAALSTYADLPLNSIYLIPVRLDDCEVPDLPLRELDLSFADFQWVDLFEASGFDKLVAAIELAITSSPISSDSQPAPSVHVQARAVPDPVAPPHVRSARSGRRPVFITAAIGIFATSLALSLPKGIQESPLVENSTRDFPNLVGEIEPMFGVSEEDQLNHVFMPKRKPTPPSRSTLQPVDTIKTTAEVSQESESESVDFSEIQLFEAFRDCPDCPEMVMLPAGSFLMGTSENDEDGEAIEAPQHEVIIGEAFAINKYEITFNEYDRFVEMTGRKRPTDRGQGRGERPVTFVNWHDAKAYCGWLGEQVGRDYRLPTEAEWEFATRAGTRSNYAFGDELTADQANFNGSPGRAFKVGTFPANPWGLHDTHGNVWEWVEDWYHDSYEGAPTDGSAWLSPPGSKRVIRGGDWASGWRTVRSASRDGYKPHRGSYDIGFRCRRARKCDRNCDNQTASAQ